MNIRLSEKHGLNPSVELCFICGESKSVMLFGRMRNDEEAPRQAVMNHEPCDKCKKIMEEGVILIEVKDGEEGSQNPFRTGYMVAFKLEVAKQIFNIDLDKHRFFFIEESTLKSIQGETYRQEKK